jgi:DNA replication protein DnaC
MTKSEDVKYNCKWCHDSPTKFAPIKYTKVNGEPRTFLGFAEREVLYHNEFGLLLDKDTKVEFIRDAVVPCPQCTGVKGRSKSNIENAGLTIKSKERKGEEYLLTKEIAKRLIEKSTESTPQEKSVLLKLINGIPSQSMQLIGKSGIGKTPVIKLIHNRLLETGVMEPQVLYLTEIELFEKIGLDDDNNEAFMESLINKKYIFVDDCFLDIHYEKYTSSVTKTNKVKMFFKLLDHLYINPDVMLFITANNGLEEYSTNDRWLRRLDEVMPLKPLQNIAKQTKLF